MKRLLADPFLHFLVLGAILAGILALRPEPEAPPPDAIVVSAGQVEHLAALYARTWRRPPTRAELEGLVRDHVREEAAYRAGLEAGLDRDDVVVRRRIRQKLEFVAEDLASAVEPTDAELREYLDTHPDEFRFAPRLSFRHVFLDATRRGDSLREDAAALLESLPTDPDEDTAAFGDRIRLDPAYANVSPREIDAIFGTGFGDAIASLEPGRWFGPLASGFGAHLVIVDVVRPGRVATLEEVRADVEREWRHARRTESLEAFYEGLVGRHEVIVEWPEAIRDEMESAAGTEDANEAP